MVDRSMVKIAIFADILTALPAVNYIRLTNAERVSVVVAVLQFRDITDNEARTTDLFGKFREESMAHVPANDDVQLCKLFLAHDTFGANYSHEFLDTVDL
ncbi:hypothetical protein F5883DRAFT_646478 [Diaporthe sp. PMI_573]|nr:hypothetical protein F5883DRAFT_646478 [Diaporthaceae sp. PMI_573]